MFDVTRGDLNDVGRHRLDALQWIHGQFGCGSGSESHCHRLTDGPREGEHKRGDDPRQGCRDDDLEGDLGFGAAESESALPQRPGNCLQCVVTQRSHHRQDHDGDDDGGGKGIEDGDVVIHEFQQGGDSGQGEVAVNDGGNPCEDLENRLDDLSGSVAGKFTEVDGAGQSDGDRNQSGADDDDHRAHEKGDHTKGTRFDQGVPAGSEEEVPKGHHLEERDRFTD